MNWIGSEHFIDVVYRLTGASNWGNFLKRLLLAR